MASTTLLLDEVDTIFGAKQEFEGLRAILNAGNRAGTSVARTAAKGNSFELVEFNIYCAKALAGIGDLPETVRDRSIVITMTRKAHSDPVERLRSRDAARLGNPFRAALDRALGDAPDLTMVTENLPSELDDRAQDCWEPLLAIADLAGDGWPDRARRAAVSLSLSRDDVEDESHGIVLLRDTRAVFGTDIWLTTSQLIERLCALELAPWSDYFGKPITGRRVAKLLRAFGIQPHHDRAGRGYAASQFVDAWSRYLPPETVTPATTVTAEAQNTRSVTPATDVTLSAGQETAGATIDCSDYRAHQERHRQTTLGWVCEACQLVAS